MRLSYRGVNNEDAQSMLEVTENEIGSMYRSQNQQLRYVRHIPDPLQVHDRKHCCTVYRPTQPSTPVSRVVPQPVAPVSYRIWLTKNKREVLDELMNSHLKNIQRSLEHRLQVARAKGDQNLIRLLEAESKQLALSIP